MLISIFNQGDFTHLELAQPLNLPPQEMDITAEVSSIEQYKLGGQVGHTIHIAIHNNTDHTPRTLWGFYLEVFDGENWRHAPIVDEDALMGGIGDMNGAIPARSQIDIVRFAGGYFPLDDGLYRVRIGISYWQQFERLDRDLVAEFIWVNESMIEDIATQYTLH